MLFSNNINNKNIELDGLKDCHGKINISSFGLGHTIDIMDKLDTVLEAEVYILAGDDNKNTYIIHPFDGDPYYARIFIDFDNKEIIIDKIKRTVIVEDLLFELTPEENYALDTATYPIRVKPYTLLGDMYRRLYNKCHTMEMNEDFDCMDNIDTCLDTKVNEIGVYELSVIINDKDLQDTWVDSKYIYSVSMYSFFSNPYINYDLYHDDIKTYMDFMIYHCCCADYGHYLSYYHSSLREQVNAQYFKRMLGKYTPAEAEEVAIDIIKELFEEAKKC